MRVSCSHHTYIVCKALYVHCTYGPVRPKNFHSDCNPYVRAGRYIVGTHACWAIKISQIGSLLTKIYSHKSPLWYGRFQFEIISLRFFRDCPLGHLF